METMSFPQVHMGVDRSRGRSLRNLTLCLVTAGLLFAPLLSFGTEDEVSTLRERIDLAERERAELCKILGAIYEEVGDADNAIKGFERYLDTAQAGWDFRYRRTMSFSATS